MLCVNENWTRKHTMHTCAKNAVAFQIKTATTEEKQAQFVNCAQTTINLNIKMTTDMGLRSDKKKKHLKEMQALKKKRRESFIHQLILFHLLHSALRSRRSACFPWSFFAPSSEGFAWISIPHLIFHADHTCSSRIAVSCSVQGYSRDPVSEST